MFLKVAVENKFLSARFALEVLVLLVDVLQVPLQRLLKVERLLTKLALNVILKLLF